MKHEGFLKYSGHFLRDHHHHYHWNIMLQNLGRKADHQAETQSPESELVCQLVALYSLY